MRGQLMLSKTIDVVCVSAEGIVVKQCKKCYEKKRETLNHQAFGGIIVILRNFHPSSACKFLLKLHIFRGGSGGKKYCVHFLIAAFHDLSFVCNPLQWKTCPS